MIARIAAVTALSCGILTVPGVASGADETNVRLVYATFTGGGTVRPIDGSRSIDVDVNAGTSECTAFVVVGTAVPTPVQCSFEFETSFTPVRELPCTGEMTAPGILTVYPPNAYPHAFVFTMRAAVDATSAYGFGTSFIPPGVGTGYAMFSFTGTQCHRENVPNNGLAEY